MLKAAGALLVILSCTAMGYGKSLNYSKRLRELEEIQKMVYFLLGEITYRREALPEAMVRVADKVRPPLSKFLREVSKAAKEYQGERFSRIFSLLRTVPWFSSRYRSSSNSFRVRSTLLPFSQTFRLFMSTVRPL